MPCFCSVPADTARNMFVPGIVPVFPTIPISMKLALALPTLAPANRLDMQIAAGMNPVTMPSMEFSGGGPMVALSMMLSLISGNFVLDELPMLEMQMNQAADSLVRNVWPRLGWLTTLKIQPLVNYAIIARLVIDLQALGIDPIAVASFPAEPPSSGFGASFTPALTRPQLVMARFLGGLPNLLAMTEALKLPPLGEPGSLSAMENVMMGLASLTPPNLVIPMPILRKLALVLDSLHVINEAFGEDAFSPPVIASVERMLTMWSQFSIPFPIPVGAMQLNNLLLTLPTLEDIKLGESIAGGSSFAMAMTQFKPPKLAIMPFLSVVMALRGSLQVALDMDPFDMCSLCPCA